MDRRGLIAGAGAALFVATGLPARGASRHDTARMLEPGLAGSLQNPAFSPDGKWLVFTRFRRGYNRGASDLCLYHLATGSTRALVSDGSSNVNLPGAVWGRNGVVVFSSTRRGHDEIFALRVSDGRLRQITDRPDRQAYEPSLSPDGKRVVFESHRIDAEAGTISTARMDGQGGVADLTPVSDAIKQPNWAPRGDRILYQARRGDAWAIHTMPAAGGRARRVTPPGISATDAVFTPDGRWLAFESAPRDPARGRGTQLWLMRLA